MKITKGIPFALGSHSALLCPNTPSPGILAFVNCYEVKWATFIQDIFTYAKLLALFIIIGTGLVQLGRGKTENFNWDETEPDVTKIALSFYSGLFPLVSSTPSNPTSRLVRLQWLELPQLCHRGDEGPREGPAEGHRHLLHHGHLCLRDDQHRLLHHPQCAGSARFRGRRCGEFLQTCNHSPSKNQFTRRSLRNFMASLHFLSPWRWPSPLSAASTGSCSPLLGSSMPAPARARCRKSSP